MNKPPSEASHDRPDDGIDLQVVDRLVGRARSGDEAAFGEVVKMYHARVHAVIFRMVNNAEDSKELAQLTWVKAWNRLQTYKQEARFFTWLYRIAVNTAMDFIRRRARQREVSLDAGLDGASHEVMREAVSSRSAPDREVEHEEIRRLFAEAVETLSPEHKAVLILREVEGRSYEEIATITRCRVGTVMSRIFYARKAIQEKLKDLR